MSVLDDLKNELRPLTENQRLINDIRSCLSGMMYIHEGWEFADYYNVVITCVDKYKWPVTLSFDYKKQIIWIAVKDDEENNLEIRIEDDD